MYSSLISHHNSQFILTSSTHFTCTCYHFTITSTSNIIFTAPAQSPRSRPQHFTSQSCTLHITIAIKSFHPITDVLHLSRDTSTHHMTFVNAVVFKSMLKQFIHQNQSLWLIASVSSSTCLYSSIILYKSNNA